MQPIRLTAADGHTLDAYEAVPEGESVGGLVVVQEVFGITDHIKRVVEQYAAQGFHAVAPAMFDRIERGVAIDYTDVEGGRSYAQRLSWDAVIADVGAAVERVAPSGRTGLVGYCWGGTVAHLAAAGLDLAAAVSYYGAGVARMLHLEPKCPIMYHFGDQDHSIPMEAVEQIRAANPEAVIHVYSGAGHGFNCEDRASYSREDARVAFERSLEFLKRNLLR